METGRMELWSDNPIGSFVLRNVRFLMELNFTMTVIGLSLIPSLLLYHLSVNFGFAVSDILLSAERSSLMNVHA